MGGWSLVFEPPRIGSLALGWAVACIAVALTYWTVRRYHDPMRAMSRLARWAAIWLRMLALAALLFLFARPVLLNAFTRFDKPVLSVLVDHSASMSIRDVLPKGAAKPVSRAEALRAAFSGARALREQLSERFDVRLSAIGGPGRLADWIAGSDGRVTDIGRAIADAAESDRPAVLLLISDGAENLWPFDRVLESAANAASAGMELHAVGVGSELPPPDVCRVRVQNLTAPRQAALGAEILVEADILAYGCVGRIVKIELNWNDGLVSQETWTPAQPRDTRHVTFMRVGDEPGFQQASVSAAVQPAKGTGDRKADDAGAAARHGRTASAGQFVHIMDDKVRVLWVESHPRHEAAFAWRSLGGDARLAISRLWLAQPLEGAWTNPLPKTAEEWRKWHLVVIGDVEPPLLPERRLTELSKAVAENGVGLVALAGARGMSAMHGQGMNDVSPVMSQRAAGAPRQSIVQWTEAGKAWFAESPMPATQGATKAPARLTGDPAAMLQPQMITALAKPKTTAQVLAETPDGMPVAALIQAGSGRVLALGLAETWRWSMLSDDGPAALARFWRQVVFSTARRQLSAYIRAEQPRYELPALQSRGGRVLVEARVADPFTGKPPPGMRIKARARRRAASGKGDQPASAAEQPIALEQRGDVLVGECEATHVGGYELLLEAGPADTQGAAAAALPQLRATGRFSVVDVDAELESPEANHELLRGIVARAPDGGGKWHALDEFEPCLRQLLAVDRRRAVPGTTRYPLAEMARGPLLILACACLSLEWLIRKRSGVV